MPVIQGLVRVNRQSEANGYFKYHIKQNILLHLQNKYHFIAHISWIKWQEGKKNEENKHKEKTQGLAECLITWVKLAT